MGLLCMTLARRLHHLHENAKLHVRTALGMRAALTLDQAKTMTSRDELEQRVLFVQQEIQES